MTPTWQALEETPPCCYTSCEQSSPWAYWPAMHIGQYHDTFGNTRLIKKNKTLAIAVYSSSYLCLVLMLLHRWRIRRINCCSARFISPANKGTLPQLEGGGIVGPNNLGRSKHREQPLLDLRNPRLPIDHLRIRRYIHGLWVSKTEAQSSTQFKQSIKQ